jgi:hypothetical protein
MSAASTAAPTAVRASSLETVGVIKALGPLVAPSYAVAVAPVPCPAALSISIACTAAKTLSNAGRR